MYFDTTQRTQTDYGHKGQLIGDGIDKPSIGFAIAEDPVHRAVAERDIPFVAIPTGLVGLVGQVSRVGPLSCIFPTRPTRLTRPTRPTGLTRPARQPPFPRRSPGSGACEHLAADKPATIGRHTHGLIVDHSDARRHRVSAAPEGCHEMIYFLWFGICPLPRARVYARARGTAKLCQRVGVGPHAK